MTAFQDLINRYPANVPEKKLKKEAKRIDMGLADLGLSSCKTEYTEEGVKPYIIQLGAALSFLKLFLSEK